VTNPDLTVSSPRNGTDPVPSVLDQVTDTVTTVADTSGTITVSPGNPPVVGIAPYYYGNVPAPTFLYLTHSAVINVDQDEVFNRWEQPTSTVPTWNGEPVAAILSGQMSFTNTESLAVGTYRITIESANLGTVDADFTGFNVEIGFGEDNPVLPVTLLGSGTGTNPTGTDNFNFNLPIAVGGTDGWSLIFNWLNPRVVPERSQQRELAIISYRVDLLNTTVYAVTPSTPGTNYLTPFSGNQLKSGWSVALDSGGNLAQATHESQVIEQSAAPDDTGSNLLIPAIDLLTASTAERAEDLLVTGIFKTMVFTVAKSDNSVFNGTFPIYDTEGEGYVPVTMMNFGGAVTPTRVFLATTSVENLPYPAGTSMESESIYINGTLYDVWHLL
jgi:hypothetical protein